MFLLHEREDGWTAKDHLEAAIRHALMHTVSHMRAESGLGRKEASVAAKQIADLIELSTSSMKWVRL